MRLHVGDPQPSLCCKHHTISRLGSLRFRCCCEGTFGTFLTSETYLQLKSAELDVKGEQCEVHVARHRWLLGVEQLLTLSTLGNWGTFEKIHMSRRMPFSSLAMFNRVGLCKMPLNIRWQIDMCALKSLTYLAPSSCGASGWQAPRPAPPIHIPLVYQNCVKIG